MLRAIWTGFRAETRRIMTSLRPRSDAPEPTPETPLFPAYPFTDSRLADREQLLADEARLVASDRSLDREWTALTSRPNDQASWLARTRVSRLSTDVKTSLSEVRHRLVELDEDLAAAVEVGQKLGAELARTTPVAQAVLASLPSEATIAELFRCEVALDHLRLDLLARSGDRSLRKPGEHGAPYSQLRARLLALVKCCDDARRAYIASRGGSGNLLIPASEVARVERTGS
jgi:hypothetical protein